MEATVKDFISPAKPAAVLAKTEAIFRHFVAHFSLSASQTAAEPVITGGKNVSVTPSAATDWSADFVEKVKKGT